MNKISQKFWQLDFKTLEENDWASSNVAVNLAWPFICELVVLTGLLHGWPAVDGTDI